MILKSTKQNTFFDGVKSHVRCTLPCTDCFNMEFPLELVFHKSCPNVNHIRLRARKNEVLLIVIDSVRSKYIDIKEGEEHNLKHLYSFYTNTMEEKQYIRLVSSSEYVTLDHRYLLSTSIYFDSIKPGIPHKIKIKNVE